MEVSKSDWKLFRERLPKWQERYMERLVKKYMDLLSSDEPSSDKFWKLEKRIKNDSKNPGVILQLRKSSMIYDIVAMINLKVISLDDIEDFSEELKDRVKTIVL